MLQHARVATRLPAQDLTRARAFYAEKLGLEPVGERPGGLLYRPGGGGEFALFQSAGRSSGEHTQMALEVDVPGLRTVDGIAEVEGNYPIKHSVGERAAWFRDSEGNLLGVGEAIPA